MGALQCKCMESWRRFCPDWTVKCADGDALREEGVPEFVHEAVRRGKWAFASDWYRFMALHREGGVYLDLDVELVAPIDDLLGEEWVAGQWLSNGEVVMEPGAGLAMEKDNPLAKRMLDHYATAPYGETVVWAHMAAAMRNTSPIKVLPPSWFSPIAPNGEIRRTADTRAIHWYAMSWASPQRRIARWLCWHGMGGLARAALAARNLLPSFSHRRHVAS